MAQYREIETCPSLNSPNFGTTLEISALAMLRRPSFEPDEQLLTSNAKRALSLLDVLQHFVIEPKINHPAEPPTHGCKYHVDLFTAADEDNNECYKQALSYEIPDCVDSVCKCGVAISPFQPKNITQLKDNMYKIEFEKTERVIDIRLEDIFDRIRYKDESDGRTELNIPIKHIEFLNTEDALVVPFQSFQEGKSYTVDVELQLDNCLYLFQEKVIVPIEDETETIKHKIIYMGVSLVLLCVVVFYILLRQKPQLVRELKKYLPFLPSAHDLPVHASDVGPKIAKELVNSQYTPLEFILNAHKFDTYEFPRNKVIIRNEIGGGAFGKVYKAEVYELYGKPGYSIAAVKKPIENAPPEEISDFLLEIETMKKIADSGGHKNVIQILACVTMDVPYMMIMELAPCGSLKGHLSNLRKEWEKRKKKNTPRHFFPDNMVIECYLPEENLPATQPTEKLKYSDLTFGSRDEDIESSGTDSYITPETPRSIPSTPGSPHVPPIRPTVRKKPLSLPKRRNSRTPKSTEVVQGSPNTPESVSSTGLPSGTETVTTFLESPVTPLIHISEEEEDCVKPVLDSSELQNFSMQIASGMAYLESIKITHRDLAARNILINENKVLKISDFGMARIGVYVSSAQKRQPLRWMAPEALESRMCDNKTDVWSFGVVLWEIASLGAFPYKNLSNESVIIHIKEGKRLERPQTCTDQVYNLMKKCWQQHPDDRPTFEDISRELDPTRGKIYVDFSKISPKYIFPPAQEAVD
ncbi:uncharacterized protein LOC115886678 [Sitophilus oryzae]|uniref:Uncharacterized protein LOC115886678 n=1 Tax=Sitophilus oryzae TaxID=7048 RepID=A0A6J2YEF9_SITOR|nr:uncharacterized protein LOC115886678 [Sitophilus oryzae]